MSTWPSRAASTGRPGPAVLLVPLDILDERTEIDAVGAAPRRPSRHLSARPPRWRIPRVAEAAALLAGAVRPVVIAGGGVHSSGSCAELAALQALGLPVGTTVMGKGRAVDETHPLSLGVVGYFMAPAAALVPSARGGHRRRRGAAGRQPHEPERHRQLVALPARRPLHPPRRRRRRDRPQLRGAAPRRRRQADARGADRGAAPHRLPGSQGGRPALESASPRRAPATRRT